MPRSLLLCLLSAALVSAADLEQVVEQHLRMNILHRGQTTLETQVYAATLTKPISAPRDAATWSGQAARLRADILSHVVLRGRAAEWSRIPTKVEWADTLVGKGYRIRKFRYQAVPNVWVPGLLYEPAELRGRVPAVLNFNGHEGTGVANSYIQERCINVAKKGMLAYNIEWFLKGQLATDGFRHTRMNQLDLVGTSGVAVMFLAQRRLVDIALMHPNADPARIAVTGLSGGGWQTIFLSALEPRVAAAVPVAGYSSFVTRAQWPAMDLGDSEQAPSDLGAWADYTAMTALMAPRPTMIVGNQQDSCCFRADYALSPLLVAARPFFALYGMAARLEYHLNYDAGHNYGQDNREALYAFLGRQFFGDKSPFAKAEIPSASDVRKPDELRVPLPEGGDDFHTLAAKIYRALPQRPKLSAVAARARLRDVLRWPEFHITAEEAATETVEGLRISRFRLQDRAAFTIPAVVMEPTGATGTTIVFGDKGRKEMVREVNELVGRKQRVVAVDLFYFGEAEVGKRDYLYALQIASLGGRALGVQAAQLSQVIRWADGRFGAPVSLLADGPRSSVIALAGAAATEPGAVRGVELIHPLRSLGELIERDIEVDKMPELFCFGLLAAGDLDEWKALIGPVAVAERN
jgi:dienelactone hydrolase